MGARKRKPAAKAAGAGQGDAGPPAAAAAPAEASPEPMRVDPAPGPEAPPGSGGKPATVTAAADPAPPAPASPPEAPAVEAWSEAALAGLDPYEAAVKVAIGALEASNRLRIVDLFQRQTEWRAEVAGLSNRQQLNVTADPAAAARSWRRYGTDWKRTELGLFRRTLLNYGLGRTPRVLEAMRRQNKALRQLEGDVHDATLSFLRGLQAHAGGKDDAAFLEAKAEECLREAKVHSCPIVNSAPLEWEKIESSATGWVRRLRLLELLKDGIALCTGADTKDWARGVVEAIPDLVEPAFWWGFTQDVALMQGVHKHGYGSYDAVRHDAAFEHAFGIAKGDGEKHTRVRSHKKKKPAETAVAKGPDPGGPAGPAAGSPAKEADPAAGTAAGSPAEEADPAAETAAGSPAGEADPAAGTAAGSPAGEADPAAGPAGGAAAPGQGSSAAKGGGGAAVPPPGEGAVAAAGAGPAAQVALWPLSDIMTRRLKRIIEHLAKCRKQAEAKERSRVKSHRKAQEWTKKEQMELLKTIMTWGLPRESTAPMARPNWKALGMLANLSGKTDLAIEYGFKALMAEMERVIAEEAVAPAPKKKHSPDCKCIICMQRKRKAMADGTTAPEVAGEEAAEDDSPTKVPEQAPPKASAAKPKGMLTVLMATRLRDRIELVDTLQQAYASSWDFYINSRPQELPPWWKLGADDQLLVEGALRHGANNWAAVELDQFAEYVEDPNSDKSKAYGNHKVLPAPKFLTRRLKTIAGAFKRFRTQAKAKGERVSKKLKAAEPSWGMD